MRLSYSKLAMGIMTSLLLMALVPSVDAAKERPSDERVRKVVQPAESPARTTAETATIVAPSAGTAGIDEPQEVTATVPETPAQRSPEAGEEINWYCTASGGGTSSSTNFRISGTIGQAAVGTSSSASYLALHGFWQDFEISLEHCCTGPTVSDVNCSGEVDITDIQVMIDHLFLTLVDLCCEEEGNINYPGTGLPGESDITDIVDLQIMIDNQFLTLDPLPPCP